MLAGHPLCSQVHRQRQRRTDAGALGTVRVTAAIVATARGQDAKPGCQRQAALPAFEHLLFCSVHSNIQRLSCRHASAESGHINTKRHWRLSALDCTEPLEQ